MDVKQRKVKPCECGRVRCPHCNHDFEVERPQQICPGPHYPWYPNYVPYYPPYYPPTIPSWPYVTYTQTVTTNDMFRDGTTYQVYI